jgi:hypothetical protein
METRMTIKFSDITGGGIPYGNNAGRPANAGIGKLYSNGEEKRLELYTNTGWQNIVSETPGVVSVSGNYLESVGSATLDITGTNFSTGAIASAIGTNGVEVNANSTTVNSIVSITTTFSGLSAAYEPYDIKVTNTSNLFGLLPDALYINQSPIWQTPAGSLGTFNEQLSITLSALSATDPESSTITYALANGSSLPSGVTLNSSSGVISGTLPDITTNTTYTFTVNATDGANTVPRTFSLTANITNIEVLVVAGGGGGGSQVGGGGGAGGLVYSASYPITLSSTKTITVGSGGAGGPTQQSGSRPGSYGSNSVFGTLLALGGGGGGGHGSNNPASGADGYTTQTGRPGGSGGGGGAAESNGAAGVSTQTSPSDATGFGFTGGTGYQGSWAGGGGGGAGGAGANATPSVGGNGGIGKQYSITGTATYYAGGGGGCGDGSAGHGQGGQGGGGAGYDNRSGISTTQYAQNGAANTGGGGGGSRDAGPGGTGGSGVVIVAYPDTMPAISSIPGTLTYDTPTRSGYRVYRFTAGTGTITF